MKLFRTLAVVISALFCVTAAIAQESYRIRSGDMLAIEVLEDTQLNRSVTVLPDGRFSFPFAGTIRAAGRTVSQVQDAIATAIASNFAVVPNVFVSVNPAQVEEEELVEEEEITIDVYFLGEVNTPGLREVAPGTTFLQALAQNGGFTRFAAQKRIQLRRTDRATGTQSLFKVNYRALANGAALRSDIVLQDGDVILVPERRIFE